MSTVREIYDALFSIAPAYMKMDWDNVGLLCGHMDAAVDTVLVALDPMPDVLEEAKEIGAQLIVTHHPLIFNAIKAVNDQDYDGRNLLFLIENGIAAINLHTNLDCAPGGVNDILAQTLGLADVTVMEPDGRDESDREYGLLRCGYVNQTTIADFAAAVAEKLNCGGLRFADGGRPVQKVAVGGGSCGSEIEDVIRCGCDTLVTADLKYNQLQEARFRGINLIDAGHFETENPVCAYLARVLREKFPALRVAESKNHVSATQFLAK